MVLRVSMLVGTDPVTCWGSALGAEGTCGREQGRVSK